MTRCTIKVVSILVFCQVLCVGLMQALSIQDIRSHYQAIEDGIKNNSFKEAHMVIGGGQNPNEIDVWYTGGTDKDYEEDPYAAPFNVKRMVIRKMLPAIGAVSFECSFDDAGKLIFVYGIGSDICGAGFDIMAAGSYRVYYSGDKVLRLMVEGAYPEGETLEITIETEKDAAKKKTAIAQGEIVRKFAMRFYDVLCFLAQ